MDSGIPQIPAIAGQAETEAERQARRRQRLIVAGLVLLVILLLTLTVAAILFLASPGAPTEKIRDIFIIFMALEFLLLGVALVILIVQLATLINLLRNEIKPILESTTETANTLRGTAVFLSDNLVEPVIKMNEYAIAMRRFMELIGLARKR